MKICKDFGPLPHNLIQYLQICLATGLRIFELGHTHIEYAERPAQERVNGIPDFNHQELSRYGIRCIFGCGQPQPEISGGDLNVG